MVAIAVHFYGECYGGGDRNAIASFLKDSRMRSTTCRNNKYESCDDKNDIDCTGDDQSLYVYLVTPTFGEINIFISNYKINKSYEYYIASFCKHALFEIAI